MHKSDFIQAINRSFGSGGMFCTLSDSDLGNYILSKVMQFMSTSQPRILAAVKSVGQQDSDPPMFLLSTEVRYLMLLILPHHQYNYSMRL